MEEGPPHEPPLEASLPSPKSTNNGISALHNTMKRLSLGTAAATELPPSPVHPNKERLHHEPPPLSPAKIRRTPSSTSLSSPSRSGTPTLRKKTSLSSVQGAGSSTPPKSPGFRRPSSTLALSSQPDMLGKSLEPSVEEQPPSPPVTASSVARDYLQKDMNRQDDGKPDLDLVVIIHDACYGHRFSRPKTSKASLSTIVERPERMLAIVLGVSCAYVRLGARHAGAGHAPHPEHLPKSFPFKVQKSTRYVPLVSPAVTSVHGTRWMNELKMMCEGAEAKLAMGAKELTRPLQAGGDDDDDERPRLHEGDLYLCSESLNALEGSLGGVLDAVDTVFDPAMPNRAFVAIRPPGHHCSDDYPSGFCWVNNVHVGISHASAVHGLTHAAIIDFDLHHGDGSQSITWSHNAKVAALPKNAPMSKRTAIGYFSIHDINSYPCEWGDEEKVKNASLCVENAHCQTIWNVHLQTWKTEAEFWKLYETRYLMLLEKTRAFLENHRDRLQASTHSPQPRAAIFISAGFDASEWEGQGMQRHKVNVPTDFYARFTRDINKLAAEGGLGVDGRVISVLEGGYSDRALTSGVLSHLSGMASTPVADRVNTESSNGLGHEMSQRLSAVEHQLGRTHDEDSNGHISVDTTWWSPTSLDELDNFVNPPPPAPPRKPRGPLNPTYTTPTQSFVAKVVSPTTRRSLSGAMAASTTKVSRPAEPPPEVKWTVAAHELSKILTPDRQTRSCKPEDLNAKATEIRRNRQSSVGIQPPQQVDEGKRMQLRGRKPKLPAAEPEVRTSSRASRRTTFGGVESATEASKTAPSKAPRRRVSIASTILSTAEEGVEESQKYNDPGARRLSSSSVARPASVASNPPKLPVEKTRKPRSPPKPRAPRAKVNNPISRPSGTRIPSSSSQASQVGGDSKSNDVDALTGGLKKMSIKLNMPPKPEQPARETKAKAVKAPRKALSAPRTSKKTTAPEPTSAIALPSVAEAETSPRTESHVNLDSATRANPENVIDRLGNELEVTSPLPNEMPREASKPTSLDEKIGAELQANPRYAQPLFSQESSLRHNDAPPSFLPPNTDTIPAPSADSTLPGASSASAGSGSTSLDPAPLPAIPLTTRSPISPTSPEFAVSSSPKHNRNELPVFTSTSPINFGPPRGIAQGMGQVLATEVQTHTSENRGPVASREDDRDGERPKDHLWTSHSTPQQHIS